MVLTISSFHGVHDKNSLPQPSERVSFSSVSYRRFRTIEYVAKNELSPPGRMCGIQMLEIQTPLRSLSRASLGREGWQGRRLCGRTVSLDALCRWLRKFNIIIFINPIRKVYELISIIFFFFLCVISWGYYANIQEISLGATYNDHLECPLEMHRLLRVALNRIGVLTPPSGLQIPYILIQTVPLGWVRVHLNEGFLFPCSTVLLKSKSYSFWGLSPSRPQSSLQSL
jgi:hypothetical protein